MKQRTRVMHSGDDLIGYDVANFKKNESENEIQLHKIRPQERFIEAQIQEGDTLQAIALRFHCSISELKRINQIHKDNEIFARRTIKIPVTPFSVLTELVPTSPEPVPSTSNHVHTNTKQTTIMQNNCDKIKNENDFAIDCNEVVLNSQLAPSVVPYTDAETSEAVSEDTKLIPNKERESVETVVVKDFATHGADFGLKWYHLVGFLLILSVVAPFVIIMFYLDKHEHSDIPPLHSP